MVRSPPISDCDYINFLVAAQCDVSCVKAAECFSGNGFVITHDAFNRFLTRQSLTPETLWTEVEPFVERRNGWLVVDDTVIDKVYSEKIALTYFQWSGNQHRVIKGIGLITLVWTDGTSTFPIDYRIYDKDGDHLSKNEHFRAMLQTAAERGFQPYFVLFDSWYTSTANLKCLDKLGWQWFSRIKKNRMVNPDETENRPVNTLVIPDEGMVVHMKKYGFVKLFHSVNKAGKDRYWATNCLIMDDIDRKNMQAISWSIENYHRALKELCCVKDCKIRKEAGQRNHINCSLRAFIRLEAVKQLHDITIYQAKWEIVRSSIRDCCPPSKVCALIFFASDLRNSYFNEKSRNMTANQPYGTVENIPSPTRKRVPPTWPIVINFQIFSMNRKITRSYLFLLIDMVTCAEGTTSEI